MRATLDSVKYLKTSGYEAGKGLEWRIESQVVRRMNGRADVIKIQCMHI